MILEAIEKIIDSKIKPTIDIAKVISVSGTSCKVESLTTKKVFFKCSLNAIIDNDDSELKITPEVNSVVTIAISNEKAIIIQVSKVKSFHYQTENLKFDMDDAGFLIERQDESLKQVINDLQDQVNSLCDVLNATVVLPGYGTTPNVGLIANIKTAITQIKLRTNKILK